MILLERVYFMLSMFGVHMLFLDQIRRVIYAMMRLLWGFILMGLSSISTFELFIIINHYYKYNMHEYVLISIINV